jgi:hypothetical protein
MSLKTNNCLFEKWQAESAPMFHMSHFWPAFNEAVIKDFLDGTANGPAPSRPANLDLARNTKDQIDAFIAKIENLPDSEYPCKSAYVAFERDRIAPLELVLNHNNLEKIAVANDQLYGQLDDLHQGDALAYLKYFVEHIEPNSPGVAAQRDLLLETWRDVTASTAITHLFGALERYRTGLRPLVEERFGFMEEILAPHADQATLSSETVCQILQATLNRVLGERVGNWRAVTKEGAPNVFIDYALPAITVPAGRTYSPAAAKALAIHEIGSHIIRSVNGDHSRERLASVGMAGYGPAEEALGAMMGNAGKPQHARVNDLIAFGVIDFATRPANPTFRGVHTLTKALMICLANPDETTLRQKDYEYGRLAFSRVIRMLRLGTNVLVERSTTKYWRGLLIINRYFEKNGQDQASLDQFFRGKYDPLNPSQLELIKTHSLTTPPAV